MVNSIDMVGSSMAMGSSGSGFSRSVMLSPISNPSIPISAQISPEVTSSTFDLPSPSNTSTSLMRIFLMLPSRLQSA